MFEITKNDFFAFRMLPDNMKADRQGVYDFTFENRYMIYHYYSTSRFHYVALDKTTGLGSYVMATKEPMVEANFCMMIPAILYSIKYTGDHRALMAAEPTEAGWVDMIFRYLLPRIGFSVREEQITMANTMYKGLTGKRITLCEAGVGTGKTMAYLTASLAAKLMDGSYRYASNPITIATSSIDLQREIIEKEIPRLSQALMQAGVLDRPLSAVLRKGREHYFCIKRYYDYVESIRQVSDKYSKVLEVLEKLDLENRGFDLDRVNLPSYIKAKMCVKGNCVRCPYKNTCRYASFMAQANRKGAFDFQVTNHNLLLMSQKKKHTIGAGLLMDSNYYIIDETHKLSDAAQSVFGAELSPLSIPDYLHAIKYLAPKDAGTRKLFRNLVRETDEINMAFFAEVHMQLGDCVEERYAIQISERMKLQVEKLMNNLTALSAKLPQDRLSNRSQVLIDNLSLFAKQEENITWVDMDRSADTYTLRCVPATMKQDLYTSLWSVPDTHWVLTSGTMQDDTGFDYFKAELGMDMHISGHAILEHSNGSPFNYVQNTRLYISDKVPTPDMDDPNYMTAVCDEIVRLVHATCGHTAILFTSYRMLNEVYDRVKLRISDYPLIRMSKSSKTAISDFKKSTNGVLFASGSMWEGVDCAGDILSSVIIVRLPFPIRSQVMEHKKMQYDDVVEFVNECAVPQMIIKLRQGAGRLVRTENDTGVIAILDSRAAKEGKHRKRVLGALHQHPLVSSISEVESFIHSVKGEEYRNGGMLAA